MTLKKSIKRENSEIEKLNKESLFFSLVIMGLAIAAIVVQGIVYKTSWIQVCFICFLIAPLVFYCAMITQCAVTRTIAPEGTNQLFRLFILLGVGVICFLIGAVIARKGSGTIISVSIECYFLGISIFTLYASLIMAVGLIMDPVICFFKYRKWERYENKSL